MAVARGQITITDLNDAKTVGLYLSANHPTTQIFNQSGQSYVPSWTGANALVITPELLVAGVASPTFSNTPTWTINGYTVSEWNAKQDSHGDPIETSNITASVGTSATNYALTLTGNMTDNDYLQVVCSGNYYDSTVQSNIGTKADITFNKSINTGQLCMARIDATGHVFKEEATGTYPSSITLNATLVRGSDNDTMPSDTTPFSVIWQKRVANAEDTDGTVDGWLTLTTEANKWTVSGRTLTIYPDGVDSEDTFRCVITDTYDKSASYNKKFPATFTIVDMTDPFALKVESSNGTEFKNGNISTTLTARLQQGGLDVVKGVYSSVTYTWEKYNANGSKDNSFTPSVVTPSGTPSTEYQQITITSSDVSSRATFMCTVSIA